MSQLDPTLDPALDLSLAAPRGARAGDSASPAGSRSCSATRSRASGSRWSRFVVIIALIAPLISVDAPERLQPARPRSGARRGTTSSGRPTRAATSSRRSSSAPGRRCCSASRPPLLATGLAAILGITAALRRRARRRRRELPDQRLPRRSPRSRCSSSSPGTSTNRGMGTMIVVLALVLWAFEARILRGAGAVAEEPRLHPRGEGLGRVDVADRASASSFRTWSAASRRRSSSSSTSRCSSTRVSSSSGSATCRRRAGA